ncbi:class I SAM-dependent methyltransferase [Aeromonas allosaccharophila]|uniref:class I SAM-dependent methyltransferase n=1 Tax=Aeromonas allosaccharophila TaxID=656 RepID=UPI003006B760
MNRFEELYRERGAASQRRYPNESLVGFMAAHYFSLSAEQRRSCRILELGCGSGANIWMLAREGFDAWGVDLSPCGIALCRDVLASWNVQARLAVGSMTKLPYEDEFFDAMVDVVSMQHLTLMQHQETIAEIHRCLKPGGRIFSYHLGRNSSVCQEANVVWLDDITVADIPAGYPLAGNGQTSFLDVSHASILFKDFKNATIDIVQRNYTSSHSKVEYLVIMAEK